MPVEQLVPPGSACIAVQVPDAHCWNEVPSQLNMPSSVQEPLRPPEPEPEPGGLTGAEVVAGGSLSSPVGSAVGDGAASLVVVGKMGTVRMLEGSSTTAVEVGDGR